jgi:hypothetical protein
VFQGGVFQIPGTKVLEKLLFGMRLAVGTGKGEVFIQNPVQHGYVTVQNGLIPFLIHFGNFLRKVRLRLRLCRRVKLVISNQHKIKQQNQYASLHQSQCGPLSCGFSAELDIPMHCTIQDYNSNLDISYSKGSTLAIFA